jgi:hypothetical protein
VQLVTSATANVNTDAFNFLSKGAGKIVFEVFLKVKLHFFIGATLLILAFQLYIGLLFVVLVCSLGNRPQGSKWMYTMCIVLFGICNYLTLWCAGYTVYLTVPHTVKGWSQVITWDAVALHRCSTLNWLICQVSLSIVSRSATLSYLWPQLMGYTWSVLSCTSNPGTCLLVSYNTCSCCRAVSFALLLPRIFWFDLLLDVNILSTFRSPSSCAYTYCHDSDVRYIKFTWC